MNAIQLKNARKHHMAISNYMVTFCKSGSTSFNQIVYLLYAFVLMFWGASGYFLFRIYPGSSMMKNWLCFWILKSWMRGHICFRLYPPMMGEHRNHIDSCGSSTQYLKFKELLYLFMNIRKFTHFSHGITTLMLMLKLRGRFGGLQNGFTYEVKAGGRKKKLASPSFKLILAWAYKTSTSICTQKKVNPKLE